MAVSIKVLLQPAGEPITLTEAKLACRVDADVTADDDFIAGLIRRARTYIETVFGICLVSRTEIIGWDRFPRGSSTPGMQQQAEGLWDQRIPITELAAKSWPERSLFRLPRNPLQHVTAIQYLDLADSLQTLDPTLYTVDYMSDPARIVPSFGNIWPIPIASIQTVKAQCVIGYGPSTTIAASISAGTQTVTPASMYGIYAQDLTGVSAYPGTTLAIDVGQNRELVTVTAANTTTFTATFAQAHNPSVIVKPGLPETLNGEMLMRIADWYTNRGDGPPNGQPLALEALKWANWNGELS